LNGGSSHSPVGESASSRGVQRRAESILAHPGNPAVQAAFISGMEHLPGRTRSTAALFQVRTEVTP
jgi:hypothetical protein